ncbi:ABC transporter substrate-binding protein [Aceticella autotrophica]|uniref:ABC transporter substrate-binding protein n=1 Tax=Aceticella autotrophica TaxID=2755338 RepID=A0A975AUP2_9THEO|nr:ABC transporter substrate-binding protein [Aceticella autotrophica]QSZ26790.1 ABC transporter substrate-binding protein [Aceticella autotrophica]
MKYLRQIVSFLVIIMLFAGSAGCGRQQREGQLSKKELVVGVGSDGYSQRNSKLGIYPLNANICEPLIRLTPEYQLEPLLATKWEYKGNNTWRFYLRKGIKFHNGKDFNASAVKYTLEKGILSSEKSMLKIKEDAVKIIDDYTVDIVTTEPNMRVPEILALPTIAICIKENEDIQKPIGTGPFRFVRYEQDKELVVERNPNYWGEPAKVNKIVFKFIPDHNSRLLALQAGEIDVITEIPREMIGQLKTTQGIQVLRGKTGAYVALYLMVNGKQPYDILQDKRIRQAIGWAIDREAIIQKVWEDNAVSSQTIIPPDILREFKGLVNGFTYNPERAKNLLEQAGWKPGPDGVRIKDGRRLELTLVSGFPSASVLKPLPEILQQQLKGVGIAVKVVEVADRGLYSDKLKKGEGDLWLERGSQNDGDPTFLPQLLFYSRGYYEENYNKAFWPGEKFDRLLEEARNTPDIRESARLTAEAMHVLIDEETTAVPLASLYTIYAAKKKIKGLTPHPSGINTRWDGVYIEE